MGDENIRPFAHFRHVFTCFHIKELFPFNVSKWFSFHVKTIRIFIDIDMEITIFFYHNIHVVVYIYIYIYIYKRNY